MLCLLFIYLLLFILFFQSRNFSSYLRILVIMELVFLLLLLSLLYCNTMPATYVYFILFAFAAVECAVSLILIFYIFN
jgi:hypothetical protein